MRWPSSGVKILLDGNPHCRHTVNMIKQTIRLTERLHARVVRALLRRPKKDRSFQKYATEALVEKLEREAKEKS